MKQHGRKPVQGQHIAPAVEAELERRIREQPEIPPAHHADALGVGRRSAWRIKKKIADGRGGASVTGVAPRSTIIVPARVRRYLVTAAQNATEIHRGFWSNLHAYASALGAELLVGPFTYQLGLFDEHGPRPEMFSPELVPYLSRKRIELGPLVFMADMNTLPTASRPISDLVTHARGHWGLVPHAKLQLLSVAGVRNGHASQVMTTGCATVPNYTERKAGVKAAFHHVIGATIVEIDERDRVFCRQINAAPDGSFQDLDTMVSNGIVSRGHRIEAATWGDIHVRKLDPLIARATWGYDPLTRRMESSDSIVDALRPRFQFFHDLLDFEARNPHELKKDPLHVFETHVAGRDSVEDEVREAVGFLRAAERDWCKSVVVESNHDRFLDRWLDSLGGGGYRQDPVNAEFFLDMERARFAARRVEATRDPLDDEAERFSLFRHALATRDTKGLAGIAFVPEGGSFEICQGVGAIECGQHGHQGPNGSRGSAVSLSRVARKMNTAHTHTPTILEGIYIAGVSARLNHGYNTGPSSWMQAHTLTYPNGKRTLVTFQDGKWRA
ncbi:hypothetical protein [Microvirga solisilvae]|uniref:hypothetical protein n=1 Tax=Microvirga solisilvae TaxID=2919498 RepID=UPI001FAFDC97|nr:hypothetical protein [Microvirga solisilvae]